MNDVRKSLEIIRETERVDELEPMGKLGRMATDIGAKLGSSKAQMSQAAREAAAGIWKDWISARKKADIQPTSENLVRWLTRRNIDSDIIDAAFKGIGIDNITQLDAIEPEAELDSEVDVEDPTIDNKVTDDTLPPEVGTMFKHTDGSGYKWVGNSWDKQTSTGKWQGGQVKRDDGNKAFVAAIERGDAFKPESATKEPSEKMPQQGDSFEVPIKDSDPLTLQHDGEKWNFVDDGGNLRPAKDDMQDNLTKSWQKNQPQETPAPTGEKLSDKAEEAGLDDASMVSAKDVAAHIEQEKGASPEQVAQILQTAGVDATSDEPIGQEALDQVTKATNAADEAGEFSGDESQEETEDTMDAVQGEMGDRFLKQARNQALEAMNGDLTSLTNLQKWGFAVLAARDSRIKVK